MNKIRSMIVVIAVGAGAFAVAQPKLAPKGLGDYSGPTTETNKPFAGKRQVDEFGAKKLPPPKPFPWLAVLLGVAVVGAAAPFAYIQFSKTKTELDSLKTFGRGASGEKIEEIPDEAVPQISRRPPSRAVSSPGARPPPQASGISARDAVLGAVGRSRQWVTAEWVARAAGVSTAIVADTLGTLAEEGHVQEAKDAAGNPVYRVAS